MIQKSQFMLMISTNKDYEEWYRWFSIYSVKYEINTPERIAAFISQAAHESNEFKILEENLNYSASRLEAVFPSYFRDVDANSYARNPERIANYVYNDAFRSSRNKLGNTQEGDGWKFRGRGIFQLTGRTNYTNFARSIFKSVDDTVEYVASKEGAMESACWFWQSKKLNRYADNEDVRHLSIAINGGENGMEDRQRRYAQNIKIMRNEITLSKGDRNVLVREVQKHLGLSSDGIFGPQTERSVINWQSLNKYTVNGILTFEQIEKLIND